MAAEEPSTQTVPGELWDSGLDNNWDRENREAEKAWRHSRHPPGLGIAMPSGTWEWQMVRSKTASKPVASS